MKKLITLALIITCSHAFAQDSLRYFNNSRKQITTTGMEVLGSWAVVNIGVGAAGWANSKGGQNKYFYQMNTIWGVANLGATLLGYISTQNEDAGNTVSETLKAQEKIEKTFVINGALDIVYIGTGLFVKHRGDTHKYAQLKGYGSSIIIQGVFLLLFDGSMYTSERLNGNKLVRFLRKNPVTFNGKGIGMIYNIH